jgi:hypothetical protein
MSVKHREAHVSEAQGSSPQPEVPSVEVTGKRSSHNLVMQAQIYSVSPLGKRASSSQDPASQKEGVLCYCDQRDDSEEDNSYSEYGTSCSMGQETNIYKKS